MIQTRFLHSRAIDSIHDIEFMKDKVSKEIIDIYASSLVCSQDEYDDEKGTGVSHVKTGIEKVATLNEDGQDLSILCCGGGADG